MISLIKLNPFDIFLWTIRRNEKDVVNLYSTLSPILQVSTGGNMLNFGYWNNSTDTPLQAQQQLCDKIGKVAELESAKIVLDVGSGLGSPANYWKSLYKSIEIICVNINLSQLQKSEFHNGITFTNSTSTKLPFSNNSLDRIIALESAQHFKPLGKFISEAKRILKSNGILILAIPITREKSSFNKLGILSFTWASEHYGLEYVLSCITDEGFTIEETTHIGSNVYGPLADFYAEHRNSIKKKINQIYPSYVEKILNISLQKMKKISEKQIIDYVIIKCRT